LLQKPSNTLLNTLYVPFPPLPTSSLTHTQHDNPSGLTPHFKSLTDPVDDRKFFIDLAQDETKIPTSSFVEATGKVGDVYLMHPFTLHSASENLLRIPRIITNPPVCLKEPFNFDREDGKYSLVEKKTLKELGKPEGLKGWKIQGERLPYVSERMKRVAADRAAEKKRLEEATIGTKLSPLILNCPKRLAS
jgi:hypothetical protein